MIEEPFENTSLTNDKHGGKTLATVLDKVEDEQGDRLCVSAGILSGLTCFYLLIIPFQIAACHRMEAPVPRPN